MARDAELDRLRAAKDLAFDRKQRAYDVMSSAGNRRRAAGDALDGARVAKQQAWENQNAAWQYL